MLQGQKYRRIADAAMDPLTVTALAISNGETDVVLVSMDIVSIPDETMRVIREHVSSAVPELDGEQVVVCATHTHSSLVTTAGKYDYPGGDVLTAAECRMVIAEATAAAVGEAWDRRRPTDIGRAFGHAVVGHNRYAVYADGHARMYGNTDREDFVRIGGYEDHGLDLLFTWAADGTLTGVVIAVPCPSQVDEHSERFTADYWHDVRVALREQFGPELSVLPLCSAAGDQSPHFLLYGDEEREMRDRRGVTEREEIAIRIADAVDRAVACTEPLSDPIVGHQIDTLELEPLEIAAPDRDAAQAEYEQVDPAEQSSNWARRLERVIEDDYTNAGEPVTIETHQLRIGDLAIVTNPFELFLDYGLQMKAQSPAAQTLTVQLSCGSEGYLPTAAARERGGYGATPPSATVGPVGGRQLVDATLDGFEELF